MNEPFYDPFTLSYAMYWSCTWFYEFLYIISLYISLCITINIAWWIRFLEARSKSSKIVIAQRCLYYPISCDAMLWKVCMMFLCEYDGYAYVNCDIMIRTRICKFMISLVCFIQGDYVMLVIQKKGYDKRTILI